MVGTFLRHKITWKQEDCKKYNQEHIFYVNPKNSIRKKDLPLPMKFIVFTIISAGPWLNFYLWLLPKCHRQWIYRVGDSGDFGTSRYQGIVKATVSYMLQHLKFKISEGLDQNWSCPESAQLAVSAKLRQLAGQAQDNFNFGLSLLKV